LTFLFLSHFIGAICVNELVDSHETPTNSDNNLIVFNFNEDFSLAVGVDAVLLSDEEQAGFLVYLMMVDVVS
jgi:hypothetical protein